jgi:hypothetical protein
MGGQHPVGQHLTQQAKTIALLGTQEDPGGLLPV